MTSKRRLDIDQTKGYYVLCLLMSEGGRQRVDQTNGHDFFFRGGGFSQADAIWVAFLIRIGLEFSAYWKVQQYGSINRCNI